jgi:hypothetical protein
MTVKLTDAQTAQLGQIPDLALAKIVGCVPQTIAKIRNAAGIPTWRGSGKAQTVGQVRADRLYAGRLLPFEAMLGKAADTEIAAIAKCSRELVRQRRVRLGIPKFAPTVEEVERAPVPHARPQLDRALEVAADLAPPFTLANLASALNRPFHLFQPTFSRWVAEGAFVKADDGGKGRAGRYIVGTKPIFYPAHSQADESYDHLLGTMSDYALTAYLTDAGRPVAYTQILRRRTKLKIDAFVKKGR